MIVFADGALTVERATGIVFYVRYHIDANQIPGDVEWSCAVEVDANGECEVKILSKTSPTGAQTKKLIRYFKSLGCTGGWWRFKNGKPPKRIIIK